MINWCHATRELNMLKAIMIFPSLRSDGLVFFPHPPLINNLKRNFLCFLCFCFKKKFFLFLDDVCHVFYGFFENQNKKYEKKGFFSKLIVKTNELQLRFVCVLHIKSDNILFVCFYIIQRFIKPRKTLFRTTARERVSASDKLNVLWKLQFFIQFPW